MRFRELSQLLVAASTTAALIDARRPVRWDPADLENWELIELPGADLLRELDRLVGDEEVDGCITAAELEMEGPEMARVRLGRSSHTQGVEPGFSLRTKRAIQEWSRIGASETILDWIRDGYAWEYVTPDEREDPLTGIPRDADFTAGRNGPGATSTYRKGTTEMIRALLDGDNTELCDHRPQMTLSVNTITKNSLDKNGKQKLRLIIDGRPTNRFIRKKGRSFRMETLSRMRHMFKPGQHLFTIDLTNSYAHMRVAEAHRDVLGFRWPASEMTEYIEAFRTAHGRDPYIDEEGMLFMRYKVLPFGICSSPAIFTRLMRVVVRYIRKEMPHLRVLQYIDDFIFQCPRESSEADLAAVRELFQRLGLKVNDKSDFSLTTVTEGLGFTIDNGDSSFSLGEKKRQRYRAAVETLGRLAANRHLVPIKTVASVAGKLMSIRIAAGHQSNLYTRALFHGIGVAQQKKGWRGSMRVGKAALQELQHWHVVLQGSVRSPIIPLAAERWNEGSFAGVIEVDASDTHWGAGIRLTGDTSSDRVAIERFLLSEANESSTLREALGLERAVETFAKEIPRRRDPTAWNWVRVHTDNLGLSKIWQRGSRVPQITEALKRLDKTLREHRIRLQVRWVPREQNQWADWLSKAEAHDTLSFDREAFRSLEHAIGVRHSTDAFAAHHNVMVDSEGERLPFFSKHACRGAKGVDFFTQNLREEGLLFVNAPFGVLSRVLQHLEKHRACATIIAPSRAARQFAAVPWFAALYGPNSRAVREIPLDRGRTIRQEGKLVFSSYPLSAVVVDFRHLVEK